MTDWVFPLLLVLVLTNLALTTARVSLLNARPLRLANIQVTRQSRIDQTLKLIGNPRLATSLRIGQTLIRLVMSILVYQWIVELFSGSKGYLFFLCVGLFVLAISLLLLEFSVEAKILLNPDIWAVRLSMFSRVMMVLLYPFTLLPLLVVKTGRVHLSPAQFTEGELKNWAESEQEPGSLEREERQMIYSIFQLGDTLTREIMIPRIDILAVDVRTHLQDAIQVFISSGHSRLPVYEGTVDNILGLLYAKDLLKTSMSEGPRFSLRELLRPAYFVPETKKADELLAEMQSRRIHMGIVVDEYGGVAGLVTLEDIVEEIIGEIRDEYDTAIDEILYQEVSPGVYLFQGRIDLDDFNEIMATHLSKEGADTLAGFLYEQMGRIPQSGESMEAEKLLFTIDQISSRRIRRVRVSRQNVHEEHE